MMEPLGAAIARPAYLRSYDDFVSHLEASLIDDQSGEKGDKFVNFAKGFVKFLPEFANFSNIRLNPKKTHDRGSDILGDLIDQDGQLHVQSKYKIRTIDEFDSIISKFQNIETTFESDEQGALFPPENAARLTFAIITSSKLDVIRERYVKSHLSSTRFYENIIKSGRLVVIDGPKLFERLQHSYQQAFLAPKTFSITALHPWQREAQTALGFVNAAELVALYNSHGDSIFFENIRGFLGPTSGQVKPDDVTVNQAITATIEESPESFVQKNNGVTFSAENIDVQEQLITLEGASIVNGCQTTMCLALSQRYAECTVVVKVVSANDSWEVAKSANFQNSIGKIELDLARYLRPQLAKKAAVDAGIAIEAVGNKSPIDLLESFYDSRVQYENLKMLFIGFFSRSPSNIGDLNYTKIRTDLLEAFSTSNRQEWLYEIMFTISAAINDNIKKLHEKVRDEDYAELFDRVFDDKRPRYRTFLGLITLCALLKQNIAEKSDDTNTEMQRLINFLELARDLIVNRKREFLTGMFSAFVVFVHQNMDRPEPSRVAQHMTSLLGRDFGQLYNKARAQLDLVAKSQEF